jgi:putative oxidoreductase
MEKLLPQRTSNLAAQIPASVCRLPVRKAIQKTAPWYGACIWSVLISERENQPINPIDFLTKGTPMNPIKKVIETPNDLLLTALRLVLGIIFLAHGVQLTFGMFGGHTLSGSITFFTNVLHIPGPLAFIAIMAEFAGGIALILGIATRLAPLSIAVNMFVAMAMHAQYGLFINWFGNKKGEGIEFHLLAIAVALPIVIRGAGAFSLDRLLANLTANGPHPDRINLSVA